METDERTILDVHTTWIAAVNAGDLDRLLSLVTDDVVFVNPGQAPSDRGEFARHFPLAQQRAQFHCVSELEEVVVSGDVAYTRSRDSLTAAPRAGAESLRLEGYRMTVYRRQSDGRWLLARDAHTLAPVGG